MIGGQFIGATREVYKSSSSSSLQELKDRFKLHTKLMKHPKKSVEAGLLIQRIDIFGKLEYVLPTA